VAEIETGHAGHHPVADDDVDIVVGADLQPGLGRFGLGHQIAPAAQLHRDDMALRPAVIDHQVMARAGLGVGRFDKAGAG